MLREISNVQKESDGRIKRWFTSDSMDLFIWLNVDLGVESFHWSYNKALSEKALIWNISSGLSHVAVDDGVRPGRHPSSPILIADRDFDSIALCQLFEEAEAKVESGVVANIMEIIREHF